MLPFLAQHSGITPCLGKVKLHRFVEEVEAVDFFDGPGGGGRGIEDNKGLPFGFEVGLRDQVDDGPVFREDFCQGGFQGVRFNALFEVADVDAGENRVSKVFVGD